MIRRLFALSALALGAACRKPEPIIRVERVQIPVPIPCPPPPRTYRPRLPIENLGPDTSQTEADRLKDATIALLLGYARQLETLLKAYETDAK